jgi:flagellar basal body-associated protein FliL
MPDQPEIAPASRKGPSKALLITIACVALGSVLGAVGVPKIVAALAPSESGEEAEADDAPQGIPLEPVEIMVNLRDERARRMLKATIVMNVKDDGVKDMYAKRQTEIRNDLISVLSEKKLEDIETKEQKNGLQREILDAVNGVLGVDDAILTVYFTEFVIQ